MIHTRSLLEGRCTMLVGDCIEAMRSMPANSVDCVVTSPPYWGLRKYLPEDAVRMRKDLTPEQIAYVASELTKAGVE
jgi:DNA modification methylase